MTRAVWRLEVKKHDRERGYGVQKDRRETERRMRKRVLAFDRLMKWSGRKADETARWISMSSGTLSAWERRWDEDRLEARPRGRTLERPGREERNEIIELIEMLWPDVSVPMLLAVFPGVARREMESLLCRCWRLHARRDGVLMHSIRWTRPGTVWAMDFAEPSSPVDGIYPYILEVRDIASGCNLLWLPVKEKSAGETQNALKALFVDHGAPLVIKSDNDGSFRTQKEWLGTKGVCLLLSPRYYPEYNGACEAGIGTLKTYAHHEASRHDRPGEWTCDDVEAARRRANELSRPSGHLGPTPLEKWLARNAVTDEERNVFKATVEQMIEAVRKEKAYGEYDALVWYECAGIERKALEKALARLGYLTVRRRRITPPFRSRFWRKIS